MTTQGDGGSAGKPVAYWVVRALMGIAIAVLGGVELVTGATVNTTVYLILASIAGVADVPEIIARVTARR